jgi:molybdopterin biosynthesis enzyme
VSLLSFDEALERLLAGARKVKGTDRVPLADALGRVLAEPIRATRWSRARRRASSPARRCPPAPMPW